MARALEEVSLATVAPDERVEGKLIALVSGFLLGSTAATVVTDRRILVQRLKNSGKPKGEAVVIDRAGIATFAVKNFATLTEGSVDRDWRDAVLTRGMSGSFIVDLTTGDGKRLELTVTFGEGGLLGLMGPPSIQIEGAAALLHALRLVERAA